MEIPADLKYSREHEWVRVEGKIAVIGITDHAQEQLGDVVMVEIPAEGTLVTKDETFGVVESVKAVSDIFAPVSGKIVEINEPVAESPGILNEDCYGEGWLVKVEISRPDDLEDLMSANAYEAYLKESS